MGIMGSRMAANLGRAGFELTVWNRTGGRAREHAESHGASVASTPEQAADGADAVVSMIVDAPEVREVLLGENGAARALAEGALAIDMSTIGVAAARDLASELSSQGIEFLDAPVSGSKPKAEDGTLTIMAGGSAPPTSEPSPCSRPWASSWSTSGPPGRARSSRS